MPPPPPECAAGITEEDALEILRRMTMELVMLSPGMSFENVLNFTWRELKRWHTLAVDTFKTIHGIK